jgi:hypothetical protein
MRFKQNGIRTSVNETRLKLKKISKKLCLAHACQRSFELLQPDLLRLVSNQPEEIVDDEQGFLRRVV